LTSLQGLFRILVVILGLITLGLSCVLGLVFDSAMRFRFLGTTGEEECQAGDSNADRAYEPIEMSVE
jgi:hypothetical protein